MKKDKYGGVECEKCGQSYDPSFKKCPYCCPHENLRLVNEWNNCGAWELDIVCNDCGKNYFDKDHVMNNYKLVRI